VVRSGRAAGRLPGHAPGPARRPPGAHPGTIAPPPVLPPQPHWSAVLTAHKPGIIPLRPLGFGDILEGSFAAIRRNPRTAFGLALLTTLVVVGVLAALGAVAYLVLSQLVTSEASDTLLGVSAVGGLTLVVGFSSIVTVVLNGMMAYPVGEGVLGRKPTLRETWRRTRPMVPRLAGLSLTLLVPALAVMGGLFALFVWALSSGSGAGGFLGFVALLLASLGVVFLSVRLTLATPALVLEDIGIVPALKRSWGLTSGRFWRILGMVVVATLLVGVVQQVLGIGFQLLGVLLGFAVTTTVDSATDAAMFAIVMGASIVGSLLAGVLTQPFMAAVTALLYTDARIRSEGFDLALVRAATGAQVAG
jgi:hypothetical protein